MEAYHQNYQRLTMYLSIDKIVGKKARSTHWWINVWYYVVWSWRLINSEINGYNSNPRGAGFTFGGDVVEKFNKENNIVLICRAHQLIMEGYKLNE